MASWKTLKDDGSMINLNKNVVAVLFLLEPQASGWTFGCSQAGKNSSSLHPVIGDADWNWKRYL